MRKRLGGAALCALVAGAGAAQEGVLLPTLNVEADANRGFFGAAFAQSAASAMKTEVPIAETPRSVSVVTQQQIQDRGARNTTQALQYMPGVVAGFGGNENRGDWLKIRGFDPTIFLDGLQSYFGYYNNARPEPFLLDSIAVLKGPSGMLYGNGAVGGIVNEVSKLPDPAAPNIVQPEVGTDSCSSRASTWAATSAPAAGCATGWSGSAAAPTGRSTSATTTRRP
jgi:iron complex outermembrane receptor protein